MPGSGLTDATTNIDLSDDEYTSEDIESGGLFGTYVSFARFFGLVTLGIGFPSNTPLFVVIPFIVWQSIVTIFSAGFIISSIWNG